MGDPPHILAVPFPAQGHVMPLLEFSHLLAHHGIKVTFVNTKSIHNKLVDQKQDNKDSCRVHLVSVPDGFPIEDNHQDSRNPVDIILESMAFHLEELIKKIIVSDNGKIDCVLADVFVGNTLEVVDKYGIKRAAFCPASLGFLAYMLYLPKLIRAGNIDENGNLMKEETVRLPLSMPAMTNPDSLWGFSGDSASRKIVFTFIFSVNKAAKFANWTLCNSFYELEPDSHDSIPDILTVGPLLASARRGHLLPVDTTCLTWLDDQLMQSVMYIAFGSHAKLEQFQFEELVHGLNLVNQPFLWVVRPGFIDEVSISYLDRFKETLGESGKIVDWAPQEKVLAHPSIACFVTHCGWNSTMEGVSNGVPLLTWPCIADQFHNQNYICDIWKVGLRLNKDENGIITRDEIKKRVLELIGDDGIRERVNKLKDMAKRNVSEGGLSSKNFHDFINKIKG